MLGIVEASLSKPKMAQLSCHAAAMSVVDCIASPTAVHSLHTELENK